jgi:nucleoside-diphosphate-sugar epimerase
VKILITAGLGIIGSYLAKKLTQDGYDVIAPGHAELDVKNKEAVEYYGKTADFIIHCAAIGGVTFDEQPSVLYDNLLMFENIASLQKPTIIFGSGAEFDRRTSILYVKEEDVNNKIPIDNYGLAKNIIAKRVQQLPYITNLRIFNCFSSKEKSNRFIIKLLSAIKYGQPLNIVNRIVDFFYIEDLYKVVLEGIRDNLKFRDINCVYKQKYSTLDITHMVEKWFDTKINFGLIHNFNHYCGNSTRLDSLALPIGDLQSGLLRMYEEI